MNLDDLFALGPPAPVRVARERERQLLGNVYAVAEARGVVLPSELLRAARAKNPGFDINLERTERGWVELRVKTARGVLTWRPAPDERWPDVFKRSGLLRGQFATPDSVD
jgi:hypothetical protein